MVKHICLSVFDHFVGLMLKGLNWEILNMNLVTFKRWDGVNDEKC